VRAHVVNKLVRQFIEEYAETAVRDPAALWGHLARPEDRTVGKGDG
jgi:hypothetical protein